MGKHIGTKQVRHKMVHGARVLVGKFICLLGKTKEIAFKVMFSRDSEYKMLYVYSETWI